MSFAQYVAGTTGASLLGLMLGLTISPQWSVVGSFAGGAIWFALHARRVR